MARANMQPSPFIQATAARSLARAHSGPIVGHCPNIPDGVEAFCWKFQNLEPSAVYDFWMIKTLMNQDETGQTVMATLQVPAQNGELVMIVTTVEFEQVMSQRHVKVMKSTVGNFGVAHFSKFKVKEVYEAFRSEVFRIENDIYRFSRDGDLLDLQRGEGPDIPLILDEEVSLVDLDLSQRAASQPAEVRVAEGPPASVSPFAPAQVKRLYFPKAMPITDASGLIVDFEVEDGQLLDTSTVPSSPLPQADRSPRSQAGSASRLSAVPPASASAVSQAPGVYIEMAKQGGDPELIVTIVYRITEDGKFRLLLSRMCTGITFEDFFEKIVIKKSGSFFRRKTKIIHIVEQLTEEKMECAEERFQLAP